MTDEGWTTGTLRAHFDQRLRDMEQVQRDRYEEYVRLHTDLTRKSEALEGRVTLMEAVDRGSSSAQGRMIAVIAIAISLATGAVSLYTGLTGHRSEVVNVNPGIAP